MQSTTACNERNTKPSRREDKKLPILDMKVYLDKDGYIVYEHYEKEVSSKLVISERSAHSTSGKRSVHVSEMIRRMLNTSRRLEWNTFTAPVLQNYMERMMAAGYRENYRLGILKAALAIYDDKLEKDKDGTTPLNRPKGYQKAERRAEKRRKKNSWGTKGGHWRTCLEAPDHCRVRWSARTEIQGCRERREKNSKPAPEDKPHWFPRLLQRGLSSLQTTWRRRRRLP